MNNNTNYYDDSYLAQVSLTGGRVDPSYQRTSASDLYGRNYTNTLQKASRQGSKVDITRRFFRANQLYVVPASNGGTGDKTFYTSLSRSYTAAIKTSANKGGPIRLPNLPNAAGVARNLGSGSASGYIQCMTANHKIANGGLVYLASSPQNIQDGTSSEIASDTSIGASQGFDIFSSVGTRQVTFSFDVYADYLPYPFNDVREYCYALKQMNYPTYASLRVNSPDVIFVYGGIRIRGIPQITFTYANTTKKGIIDKATVSVQITETEAITNGTARI